VTRVLITDCDHGFFGPEETLAAEAGAELLIAGGAPDADRARELGATADAILCQYLRIDAPMMEALPRCRVVGRYGVGLDNVDLDAARERGLTVVNVPDFCVEEVANHALALALSVTRRISPMEREWRRDPAGFAAAWNERFSFLRGVRRSSGERFGVVGLGRIGRAVAERAAPFGWEVVAHDPFVDAATASPAAIGVGLEELLETSEVVSLHLPLSAETTGLIDASRLALMDENAVLVNTSRGGLVNEDDLVAGLRAGRPGWAALDVFQEEPLDPGHALFSLPNVVLTPHVAFYSEASVNELKQRAMSAVLAAVQDGGAD
jgi:D-3-phosphoglycerate dehydrogenase